MIVNTVTKRKSRPAARTRCQFRHDVLAGLSRRTKRLPCKYLYDEEGARLFEEICLLEEYYPARVETKILRQNLDEICSLIGPQAELMEFGSGSGVKTRLLFEHLDCPSSYLPVDLAERQLLDSCAKLVRDYPWLEVLPLCADFTNQLHLPVSSRPSKHRTVFFPGSTIGNFDPTHAVRLLGRMAAICGPDGGILIGVDLKKDARLLLRAYNDQRGVTAEFNLNLLRRANRELSADFDLAQFRHQAIYADRPGRIEMHLVSCQRQVVHIDEAEFRFEANEPIVTEHCYKYSLGDFAQLAAKANLKVVRSWTDDHKLFSVYYLVPNP